MSEQRLVVNHPGGQAEVFFVFGQAVPQPRPKVTVRCGFGQAYVPKKHAIHRWRASVEDECRKAILETIAGPVALCIEIRVKRPDSHFTKRGELSSTGRAVIEPAGDWDNLAKAIQDAIVDAAGIEDDRKACGPNVVYKRWATANEDSGAIVWVSPAELVWCTWGGRQHEDGGR
jgi:Holliday junction resolvase RusA-like endonuclease